MFAPDSSGLLIALAACALLAVLLTVRRGPLALRLIAGLCAIVVAFVAGAAAVNVYFGYFTSWGDVLSGLGSGPAVARVGGSADNEAVTPAMVDARVALLARSASGYLLSVPLRGTRSGIDRSGYVWLPPQYRDREYAHTRFPVVELIPGTPGQPSDWLTNLHVTATLAALTAAGRIRPVVVVMAPSNPPIGAGHGQECTDAPNGPQDGVYIAEDVPADVAGAFRVAAPGAGWAIGGYSSGGYCAANLTIQHPGTYQAVADLDGYLSPLEDGGLWHVILHRDAAAIQANDIAAELRLHPTAALPPFYLQAGSGNREDLDDLDLLRDLLGPRTHVVTHVSPHAGHTFPVWRAELPPMLEWLAAELGRRPVGVAGLPVAAPPVR